jgi:hypothetical protein
MSKVRISPPKPFPSAPSRFSSGTNISVKNSSRQTIARWPILRIGSPTSSPAVPASTRNADTPLDRCAGSVLAKTT